MDDFGVEVCVDTSVVIELFGPNRPSGLRLMKGLHSQLLHLIVTELAMAGS